MHQKFNVISILCRFAVSGCTAVEKPEVVDAVRAIREADGKATLTTIADRLLAQGFTTSTGKPLLPVQIHRICKANGIGKAA